MLTSIKKRRYQNNKIRLIEDTLKVKDCFKFYNNHEVILQNIKLTDKQKDVINAIEEGKNVVVKKSRQCGMTTVITSFLAGSMCFDENKNFLLYCSNFGMCVDEIDKIRDNIDNIIHKLGLDIRYTKRTKDEIRLNNGCKIITLHPSSPLSKIKGMNFDLVFCDEFAWSDYNYSIQLHALMQFTQFVLISTPNHEKQSKCGEYFKMMYNNIMFDKNQVNIDMDYHYNLHYMTDKSWLDRLIEIYGNDKNRLNAELYGMFID